MVLIAPLVGAAVFLSGFAAALPTNNNNYGSSSDSSSNYGGDSSSNYGGNSGSNYGGDSSSNYGGDSSSNYGGNSGSNYGGNSGSNYGGSSGSNYGGNNNNYDTTSSTTMMMDSTSTTMMMDETSSMTMMMDTTSVQETSTTTSYNSQQTSNYGSGSNYWGGSGYDDCVNQCIAQYGGPSMGGSYQATATSGSGGNSGSGSGATHTVLVAPTKGVFRMVPVAVNASVGDVVEFHWGASNHTVTKSSALTPCNKSSDAPVFASGEQNQGFVFSQVVNDTNPTFYYCGTPGHCEKGMFGVINPAQAAPGSPNSLAGMMSSMAVNDSDLSAYAAYSSNVTTNNEAAASWASNLDLSVIPEWAHSLLATNVLYTRATLGMNPEVLNADNSVDLSSVAATPLMLPMDITPALDASASAPASSDASSDAPAAAAAAAAPSAESPAPSGKTSAAVSLTSSRLLVAAFVVVATVFAL